MMRIFANWWSHLTLQNGKEKIGDADDDGRYDDEDNDNSADSNEKMKIHNHQQLDEEFVRDLAHSRDWYISTKFLYCRGGTVFLATLITVIVILTRTIPKSRKSSSSTIVTAKEPLDKDVYFYFITRNQNVSRADVKLGQIEMATSKQIYRQKAQLPPQSSSNTSAITTAKGLLQLPQTVFCDELTTSTIDFDITYDANPSEVSYSLTCLDGITYLAVNVDSGEILPEPYALMSYRICIPTVLDDDFGIFDTFYQTCTFTITDNGLDGLVVGSPGRFTLYQDQQIVHMYDGEIDQPFEFYSICFGQSCDSSTPGGASDPTLPPLVVENNSPEGGSVGFFDDDGTDDTNAQFDDLHPEFYVCQDLVFSIFFDAHPEETAYTLECDNTRLWDQPYGSYTIENNDAYSFIQATEPCVERSTTCVFTVYDSAGNGMRDFQDNSGAIPVGVQNFARPGYFALLYGAQTVALYDGALTGGSTGSMDLLPIGGGGPFNQLSYCFGPNCKSPEQVFNDENDTNQIFNGESENLNINTSPPTLSPTPGPTTPSTGPFPSTYERDVNCNELVELFLRVDEFPTETSYTLFCNVNVNGNDADSPIMLWNVEAGTFKVVSPFDSYVESLCLDTYTSSALCCTFTMQDSWGDGITSPQDNLPGYYELRWANTVQFYYDGSNENAVFTEMVHQFGTGC